MTMLLETTTVTLSSLLSEVSTAADAVIALAADVGETIVSTPALVLFAIAIPLCGIGVSMFKRLISVN